MIQTDQSSIQYNGNNSTITLYPVPFYFLTEPDLVVVVKDANDSEELQVLGTDYVVNGEGNLTGGSIRTTWPVPVDSTVAITRSIDATQLTTYEEGDSFPAKSHERALDKLTMLAQQSLRVTGSGGSQSDGRAFRLTDASTGISAISKVNDTILGLDSFGEAVLRTPGEMLGWLGTTSTVWQDSAERLTTRGAYAGQLGVQLDNGTIYIANSTAPGDWFPFLIGTGIVGATDGVPHLLDPPSGDLVGTTEAQTLYNKTLESPTIHTPAGLTKSDVGLSQVDNTSDLNKPLSSATGAALAFKQDKTEKGISNGYASLDGGGKVPITQIPDAVLGASQYKGTWNAATNSPSITTGSAPGKTGWYYSVAVAGTTTVDGISSWAVGDQIISNGTVWQKIVNVSAVSSVNSKTGAVVLVPADLNLGNVDNTSDATKNSAAVTLTNHTINGANNTLIVRLDADVTNNLPINRLNNGTGASGTTWWCGDGSWKQPPGTGDISGPAGSNDGELALYSGTTGKIIRRFSGTAGFAKASATGVLSTQAKIMGADVDPSVISAQPVKTTPGFQDSYLLYDFSTGLLKSTPSISVSRLPRNYLAGLTLKNTVADAANDIDIMPGECRDGTNSADIVLTADLTKRLDAAWVAGTNQGGRDTGVVSDGTWHIFVICNPTTNAADVLFSKSLTSPTLPSGFSQLRRIGSIMRISGTNTGFRQIGDYFQLSTPTLDMNDAQPTVGQVFGCTFAKVPMDLKFLVRANFRAHSSGGAATFNIREPDVSFGGVAELFCTTANVSNAIAMDIWSGTSAEITITFATGVVTAHFFAQALGYWDKRGKDT